MKSFLKNPSAFILAIFLIAFGSAFAISAAPDITPAPNWHVSVDTLASHVTWFGHTGINCASFGLPMFLKRPAKYGLIATVASFIGTLFFAGLVAKLIADNLHVNMNIAYAIGFALVVGFGVADNLRTRRPYEATVVTNDLLKQIWINQIMEHFYDDSEHLMRSQDMSEFVENNTIHLGDAGIQPTVLVNNTVYPVPVDERADVPLDLPLDYFDTTGTVVRNAEAVQLAYNKMESVLREHRNTLAEKCRALATYNWTPASNSALTPVFGTTGNARTDGSGLKGLALADIARAQKALNKAKAPKKGRILVLSPEGLEDITNEDRILFKRFMDQEEGKPIRLSGFDVYVTALNTFFDYSNGTKLGFGAAANGTTGDCAAMFYLESEVMRADGDVKMFARLNDPEAKGDIVNFQKRFIGLSIRNKYNGAIYATT